MLRWRSLFPTASRGPPLPFLLSSGDAQASGASAMAWQAREINGSATSSHPAKGQLATHGFEAKWLSPQQHI